MYTVTETDSEVTVCIVVDGSIQVDVSVDIATVEDTATGVCNICTVMAE